MEEVVREPRRTLGCCRGGHHCRQASAVNLWTRLPGLLGIVGSLEEAAFYLVTVQKQTLL
jgi:hypothetical protein